MAVKKTGISRDLIFHPGETLAEVLEERGITQAELAAQTGVSPAFISNVIKGKKDISAKFAFALEYALDVPKSFWMNLQAHYDAELLEFNEMQTITDEEREARAALNEVVKYLRQRGKMPVGENRDASILSLRKVLQFSNIANLKDIIPEGAFRMAANTVVEPYVMGAWIRLCQLVSNDNAITARFNPDKIDELVEALKRNMRQDEAILPEALKNTMSEYGIDFALLRNFRGAPVQGYISQKSSGVYQMVLTLRGSFADIFWFSLFHELGHIMNGDVGKTAKFVDMRTDGEKEIKADQFAGNKLLSSDEYDKFIKKGSFDIESIEAFASSQSVMPYVVIGRLQKEKRLPYSSYSSYRTRYKWAK
ncbi:MAG: HigA family addiction module antitoxin [Lachnospiraceae bacterium]|nr:HigA family addiction module antitoxin [Lachnospiraceae bacterium]